MSRLAHHRGRPSSCTRCLPLSALENHWMAPRTKRIRTALLAVLGLAVFVFVVFVLLLKHTPSFYIRIEHQPAYELEANYKSSLPEM